MTPQELQRRIKFSTMAAIAAFAGAVIAYTVWFAFIVKAKSSEDPAAWGQFGDFVGGAMNPLIAFLAFYWLTQSIKLQRQELTETKRALVDSATSQGEQVKLALAMAKIHALSAIVHAHNTTITTLRDNIEFVGTQVHRGGNVFTPEGTIVSSSEGIGIAAKIGGGLETALNKRLESMIELEALLSEFRTTGRTGS